MSPNRMLMRLFGVAGLAALAACSNDAPVNPTALDPSFDISEAHAYVYVCKVGLDAGTVGQIFEFSTSAPAGTIYLPAVTMAAIAASDFGEHSLGPDCRNVYSGLGAEISTPVTVTETIPPGFQLVGASVWDLDGLFSGGVPQEVIPVDGSVTVFPGGRHGRVIVFKNAEEHLGEGCTPGYWRQEQHYDSWVGYSPSDLFSDVFGVGPAITLGEAVQLGGGGAEALMRHAVAALLNTTSPDVDYELSTAQVIAMVQTAFASGDFEETKDVFDELNNSGCTLD